VSCFLIDSFTNFLALNWYIVLASGVKFKTRMKHYDSSNQKMLHLTESVSDYVTTFVG
jgi:hypothetical protein